MMEKVLTLREVKEALLRIKPVADSLKEKKDKLHELYNLLARESDELEVMYLKTRVKELELQVRRHISRIEDLGGNVVRLDPLFISFLTKVNNKLIWLSWREGEEGINYWYEYDEDVSKRKPLSTLYDSEEIL